MDYESAVLDVLNVSQLTNGMLVSSFIYCMFYQENAISQKPYKPIGFTKYVCGAFFSVYKSHSSAYSN